MREIFRLTSDFYNHERLQAKLNGLSPMEYRTKAA
ncbi:IS3 family transposase [Paenibacillus sp. UNC496MF]